MTAGGLDVLWYARWLAQSPQGPNLPAARDFTVSQLTVLFGRKVEGTRPAHEARVQARLADPLTVLEHHFRLTGASPADAARLAREHLAGQR